MDYICAPFRGNEYLNTENALNFATGYYNTTKRIPYVPHNHIASWIPKKDWNNMEVLEPIFEHILDNCDRLIVVGSNITEGMQIEIDYCKAMDIEIDYKYNTFNRSQDLIDIGQRLRYNK